MTGPRWTNSHSTRTEIEILRHHGRSAALARVALEIEYRQRSRSDNVVDPNGSPDPDERAAIIAYELLNYGDAESATPQARTGFGKIGELCLWQGDGHDVGAKPDWVDVDGHRVLKADYGPLEYCQVCSWPLPLKWPPPQCEFPYFPRVWWRGDRPAYCHCSGCLTRPKGYGRKYCSPACEATADNARDRAKRAANGAKPRQRAA